MIQGSHLCSESPRRGAEGYCSYQPPPALRARSHPPIQFLLLAFLYPLVIHTRGGEGTGTHFSGNDQIFGNTDTSCLHTQARQQAFILQPKGEKEAANE